MQSPPQEQVEVRFMIHFTNIFIKQKKKKKSQNRDWLLFNWMMLTFL